MILSCTTVLFSPPGFSSMDTEIAVVPGCIDPDLEVVWQLKQKDKVRMVLMVMVRECLKWFTTPSAYHDGDSHSDKELEWVI